MEQRRCDSQPATTITTITNNNKNNNNNTNTNTEVSALSQAMDQCPSYDDVRDGDHNDNDVDNQQQQPIREPQHNGDDEKADEMKAEMDDSDDERILLLAADGSCDDGFGCPARSRVQQ